MHAKLSILTRPPSLGAARPSRTCTHLDHRARRDASRHHRQHGPRHVELQPWRHAFDRAAVRHPRDAAPLQRQLLLLPLHLCRCSPSTTASRPRACWPPSGRTNAPRKRRRRKLWWSTVVWWSKARAISSIEARLIPATMAPLLASLLVLPMLLSAARAGLASDSPWVTSTTPVEPWAIRVTTLGSGSPDVRRHQVRPGSSSGTGA